MLFECGRRGLRGAIIRPGYVVGDSKSAVTNTDDFVWRLVKGCVQLGLVPDMVNTINMVPVDHVARCVSAAAIAPGQDAKMRVAHVHANPLPTFNGMFDALKRHGWNVEQCEYVVWRRKLEQHVLESQDNALFPLLHFVLDDLPTSTKAPALDDKYMREVLKGQGEPERGSVGEEEMGRYLAWLVRAEFLPAPTGSAEMALPVLEDGGATRAVGRSGA